VLGSFGWTRLRGVEDLQGYFMKELFCSVFRPFPKSMECVGLEKSEIGITEFEIIFGIQQLTMEILSKRFMAVQFYSHSVCEVSQQG